MLHDVGTMLMAFADRERMALGFDHAQVVGYLLRLWKVGAEVAEAVEAHHQLGVPDRSAASLAVFSADYAMHHLEVVPIEASFSELERNKVAQARAIRRAASSALGSSASMTSRVCSTARGSPRTRTRGLPRCACQP